MNTLYNEIEKRKASRKAMRDVVGGALLLSPIAIALVALFIG